MIAMTQIVAMLWAVTAVVGAAANEPLNRRATFPASSSETKQVMIRMCLHAGWFS